MGAFPPIKKNFEGLMQDLDERVDLVERRQRISQPTLRGTAAARDLFYGVPTTLDERLALVGKQWWDSTYGIWFSYYCGTADAGAPPGGRAQGGGGWFPNDSHMPSITIDMQATINLAAGVDTKIVWRTTAPAYDPYGMYDLANSRVNIPFAGLWTVKYKLRSSANSGGINATLRRDGGNYSRIQASNVGTTGVGTTVYTEAPVYSSVGSYFEFYANAVSALALNATNSFAEVTYQGPAPS